MTDPRRHYDHGSQSKQPAPSVRLSCEMCRQRKVKCDKLNPCTNCQRFGAACVPVERARLPRGRSGRLAVDRSPELDPDLTDRVAKLEQLIENLTRGNSADRVLASLEGDQDLSQSHASPGVGSSESNASTPSENARMGNMGSSVNSPFWGNLPQQTQNLNGAVESGEKRDFSASSKIPNWQTLLLEPTGAKCSDLVNEGSPLTFQTRQKLYQMFLERVDPVFRVIHRPSLHAFLLDGKPYLDYKPGDPAPTALAWAVYYAATCTIYDEECLLLFGCERKQMTSRFQKEAEAALTRADFIVTNDLTVLQAFALSLLASRSQDQSRRVWTMLSMAVRVGQALLLHLPDPTFPVPPFEREMRRRLWHAIAFLDTEAAMDRASEPMIQASVLESHPPSNVNDDEIWFGMEGPIQESKGFTDMTFTLMASKAGCCTRLLNFSSFGQVSVQSMNTRQQIVVDFQRTASNLLNRYQADGVPFHWFTRHVAECINASLQLTSIRPMQRNANFTPPKIKGDGLLQLAVNVLQKSQELRTDPRSRQWLWVNHIFVPWHGLAVAIAEISVCDDMLVMERQWPYIEQAYERLKALAAESQRHLFWKPIEKLMAQAQTRRTELLNAAFRNPPVSLSTIPQVPTSQPLPYSQPSYPSIPLTTSLNQSNILPCSPVITMPETYNGLGPWPNVWDAMDLNDSGLGTGTETSWLNYESFIDDMYQTADYILMPR